MDHTHAADLTSKMRGWINPPRPGRNKNPAVALLMGFLLGPIGVALYLRSLVDGGLSLVAVMLVMLLTGWSPEWVSAFVGAAWAVGRILYDNQPPANPKPGMATSPGSMQSESEIPAGAMT
jgi:hypothetical protein